MDIINNRTISALPLSIGTSLAFESVFEPKLPAYDPTRVIPQMVNLGNYNSIWVNVTTLIRNIIGALPKDTAHSVSSGDVKDALIYEMQLLAEMTNAASNSCRSIFYHNTYKGLFNDVLLNKFVKFRRPTTDIQLAYDTMVNKTLSLLDKDKELDILSVNKTLIPDKTDNKALIFTHMPYDLVSYENFHRLDLIESHTGKLKTRKEWYSKYYPIVGSDMSILPFTRKLLLIMGDHVLIKPIDIRFRRLIMDIAVKRKWTPLTTPAKIRMDLETGINEKYLLEVYDRI